MADDVLVKVFPNLSEAEPFLRKLATVTTPWTFDIETYDVQTPAPEQTDDGLVISPGRKAVAVNPFHPDFRVRGIAIAISGTRGAWIELASGIGDRLTTAQGAAFLATSAMEALALAFGSDTEKGAFNGSFDENGLISAGWVPTIRNRTRDGMLGLVAIGDGTQAIRGGLTLQTAIQKLLKHEVYWEVDKGLMRDLPLAKVADGAVHDACYTHELCDFLDLAANEDRHIEWSKIISASIKETMILNYMETEESDGL